MSFGGGGTQTVTRDASPWAPAQPFIREMFEEAAKQFRDPTTPQFFPRSTTAGLDPATVQAQESLTSGAGRAEELSRAANESAVFSLGPGRDVNSNPYLQAAIQAAIDPTIRAFTEPGGALSNIRTAAQTTGGQGQSTRQGIAEGLALDRLSQNVLNTGAIMANQGFQTGQDAATRALALAPGTAGLQYSPAQALDAVGQQRRAFEQELIDEEIARHNFAQNVDRQKLADFQSFVSAPLGGQGNTTSPGPTSNPLLSAAGGAAAGASLATALSLSGPWGAAIGAMIGLFGS